MSYNHPRRSAQKMATSPPSLHFNSLRKSDTFSARTGLRSSLFNPQDTASPRPRRSPTSLDESSVIGLAQLATTRQEIVDRYLREVDDALHGDSEAASLKFMNNQHVLAVPSAVADQITIPEFMDLDEKKPVNEHHHCSDSGLGSSVDTQHQDTRSLVSALSTAATIPTLANSAITKSFSADSVNSQHTGAALSPEGLRHIQENILEPLLANLSLKEFHPLISAVPSQAQAKIISNLRDLEKHFLYDAPRFSSSPKAFLKFWEFSIQCLHTTVDYLTERDQKRPSDRPYTNNYFLDLVEQIKRYAAIMRQTREKEDRGEATDDNDYSPDEQVTIQGGFNVNGRPAELVVRKKNGKSMSLVPDEARSDFDGFASLKRAFQDDDEYDSDDDDDDVLRSMARRRKSDKAGDIMHVCSDCKKEFKRPCDLTKHEKTHSRPFKCTDRGCRYHEEGWPTEKERDRHVNDKHSQAPKMFHCNFPPCAYSSKRDSNCKQHMEKAHGWTYVRSKSNGRKRAATGTGSVNMTPPTPLTPLSATAGYTPDSAFAPSPWSTMDNGQQLGESSRSSQWYGNTTRRDSVTTANTNYTYSPGFSPQLYNATATGMEFESPANFKSPMNYAASNFDFNSPQLFDSNGLDFSAPIMPVYQQQQAQQEQQLQQLDALAMTADTYNFSTAPALSMPVQSAPLQPTHFSPIGQGDVTLFSADADEGYGGGDGLLEDFVLFPPDTTHDTSNTITTNWAVDTNMTNFGSQFDNFYDHSTMFPPQ